MSKCPIMQRMKENYENRSKTFLTRKIPVIMRLDGKAFHTYTKGLVKPFDEGLIKDMQKTAIYLCENIQGAKCAYTQSDEISILITDYDKLTTEAWFNYNVQKMTSVSASLATSKFNQLRMMGAVHDVDHGVGSSYYAEDVLTLDDLEDFILANFDSRVFSIPQSDVNNYFLARQRDAEKNSVAMLAQSLYSHKELYLKNGSDMQEMCFQKGHNWNDLHFSKKRGSLIVKQQYFNGKLPYLKAAKPPFKVGDIWFDPTNLCQDKRGRLMEFKWADKPQMNCWCDIEIKSIRNKWEVVETPIFSQDKIIESLI